MAFSRSSCLSVEDNTPDGEMAAESTDSGEEQDIGVQDLSCHGSISVAQDAAPGAIRN